MIAKRILRGKAGKFGRLGAYIAQERGAAPRVQGALALREAMPATKADEQAIWQRTADYILDAVGSGERVAAVRITNCHATELDMAIAEIEATQGQNVRARGDKTYHLVVSFPPGEKPTPEQLIDIEDELCRAIGLGKHQRISAVHIDTAHLHIHVAINQVHPQTHACIEPWQDRPKLMRACARLEIKHGLQRTHQGKAIAIEAAPRLPMRAEAMEVHGGTASFAGWIREEARLTLLTAVEQGQSWQDLHVALGEHGLDIRPRGAGLIIAQRDGRAAGKASSVDRRLSRRALEARWGPFAPPDPDIKLQPVKRYGRKPMHEGGEIDALYEEYQRLREDTMAARAKAEIAIDEQRVRTQIWYKRRCEIIANSVHLSMQGKEYQYADLNFEAARKKRGDVEFAKNVRANARRINPLPTWQDFLRQVAAQGDAAALGALRRHQRRYRTAIDAVLKTDKTGAPAAEIAAEFRPEVRANGDVVYRLRDGGRVVDSSTGVRVEKQSHIGIALALSLQAERAANRQVSLPDPELATPSIAVAARERLDLIFDTPEHEAERRRLLTLLERQDGDLAAAVLVKRCNARTAQDGSPHHRICNDSDVEKPLSKVSKLRTARISCCCARTTRSW